MAERADGAAVDAGGEHAGKETAIEARIAGEAGCMALFAAEARDPLILRVVTDGLWGHGMQALHWVYG